MKIITTGLDELIKIAEKIATPREIEETDKKAMKRIGDMAQSDVKKLYPRSKDVSKSGRKGSRTFKHSKDNIPIKVKKKKGKLVLIVGWEKSDSSPYFYNKFIEWGTSKQPPKAPFKRTFDKNIDTWNDIFIEEYNKLVQKLNV